MSKYSEVVEWDDSKGELFLPNNVDNNKEIWYPVRDENVTVGKIKNDNFLKGYLSGKINNF